MGHQRMSQARPCFDALKQRALTYRACNVTWVGASDLSQTWQVKLPAQVFSSTNEQEQANNAGEQIMVEMGARA